MQRAVNKQGKSVLLFLQSQKTITNWKQNKDIFYCPVCQEKVIIRAGKKVIPHFAHIPNAMCLLGRGGEGAYHERGKLQLFTWLSHFNMQVELEVYFPEISQRADIYIQVGRKKIAVEFQCARISQEEILHRMNGYRSIGMESIWILGATYLKQKGPYLFQADPFLDTFIRSSPQKDYPQLFFYDPFISEMAILHHLYPLQTSKVFAKQLIYPLRQLHFKHLFQQEKTPDSFAAFWVKEVRYLRTKVEGSYGTIYKLRRWLYKKGYLFQCLPSICFMPIPYRASIPVPFYKWQTALYVSCLADLKTGDRVRIAELERLLHAFFGKDIIDFSEALHHYLQLLQQTGFIEMHSSTILRTNQRMASYSSQEKAFLGDQVFFSQFFTEKKAKYEHDSPLFRYTK
ncbi:competence protein CoiA [Oceanobacillus locisalsi]|uniref:Competence protein CoiA n=1 Tax=Oceanobacillus locisalsi TaxID=546107 RepID=A0ABW3NLQ2_9BACI